MDLTKAVQDPALRAETATLADDRFAVAPVHGGAIALATFRVLADPGAE